MKRIFVLLLLALVLITTYASKPDDKTCIIAAVKAVWGNITPDVNTRPQYFEQFMNTTSKDVRIDDWVFVKRIQYHTNTGNKTVGYGAFKRVFFIS